FICRKPAQSIASICNLFRQIGSDEYSSETEAAEYYESRVETLLDAVSRLDQHHAIITHQQLVENPEAVLNGISSCLALRPPLENRYVSNALSTTRRGAGDPLVSGKWDRIVKDDAGTVAGKRPALQLKDSHLQRLDSLYHEFERACTRAG
ncbi:MAG: hypothetical protein ACK5NN_02755, partial [Sphingomonadaceae bacterium]